MKILLSGVILATDAHFRNIRSFVGVVVSHNGTSTRGLADGTIVTIHNPNNPVLNPSREWIRVEGWRAGRTIERDRVRQWADRIIDRNVLDENEGVRGNPRNNPMPTVVGITLHHDGGANDNVFRTAQVFRDNWASGRDDPGTRRCGYHFIIGQDGSVSHLIPINETALHAGGNTPWGTNANATTVSIAFVTPRVDVQGRPITRATANDSLPYDVQYIALVNLVAYLIAHHDIPPRVTTHSRIIGTSSPNCPPIFSVASFTDAEERFSKFLREVSTIVGFNVTPR